jgi:ribA/ribD-fused uncharacterized protein
MAPDEQQELLLDKAITSFTGKHFFLCNFYPHAVEADGEIYPTNEHAFQALKTLDPEERRRVREAASPDAAKHIGRQVTLRPGWNRRRFDVMEQLVRAKFADRELGRLLAKTDELQLIEGNAWSDRTWGAVERDGTWEGQNELGKILMRVRGDLRNAI